MAENTKPLKHSTEGLACGLPSHELGLSLLVHGDCFEWLKRVPESTIHAIVTDPPYGVKEFDADQLEKRANGKGGIWRLPPAFDGHVRSPLPRFTALDKKERKRLEEFFVEWSRLVLQALRPGGHVFIASNTFLSQLVFSALSEGGLEFRGEIIRLLRTFRGGDRPKGAEKEFPDVCSMPRGCFEPWGLFRKPLPPKMTVGECLRRFQTGGLRRLANGGPFLDVIQSGKTPQRERSIAGHPSLKPQAWLRPIVFAALPLGKGVVVDTFSGSGSTVAACEASGIHSVGIERNQEFFEKSLTSVPKLAALTPVDAYEQDENGGELMLPFSKPVELVVNGDKSNSLPSSRSRCVSRSR